MKSMKWISLLFVALMTLSMTVLAAGQDWNAILSDYEKVTDQLVSVYTKLKGGDANAATELQALTPKYQELSTKIAQAVGTALTPEQLKKFQEIAAKYQKALAP